MYLTGDPNGSAGNSENNVFLSGHVYLVPYGSSNVCYFQARRLNNLGTAEMRLRTYDNENLVEAMNISGAGNVSIGTIDAQGYKLAVNGNSIFTSIKVKLLSAWPDYVFKRDYRLRPLADLEKYIQQNGHLPEMPSATEAEKEGVDVGANQTALLKKTEELTLYIIE